MESRIYKEWKKSAEQSSSDSPRFMSDISEIAYHPLLFQVLERFLRSENSVSEKNFKSISDETVGLLEIQLKCLTQCLVGCGNLMLVHDAKTFSIDFIEKAKFRGVNFTSHCISSTI